MAAYQHDGFGEPPVDPLLGQPRMVADPRISIAQASVILGKNPPAVHRLVRLGRLPRHGPPNNGRPLLLSEVQTLAAKGDPISMDEAAGRLGRSVRSTRELVADGRLSLAPGTMSMVYPADVTAIATTPSPPPIRRPAGPPGHLTTKQAAERLGLSTPYVGQMAAEGKLPAEFLDGQWWFDPQRIELVRRARRDRVVARPLRRTHRRPAP